MTSYEIIDNSFRQFEFQSRELNPSAREPSELIKDGMPRYMENTIQMDGNAFDSPGLDNLKVTKAPYCPWVELNGESCRTSASNNVREVVEPVTFANFFQDIPADVDYLLMEKWSDTCGLCSNSGESISYNAGDYVFHKNNMYQAKVTNSAVEPGSDDAETTWDLLPVPVDDVRLACNSAHQGVGLLDTVECTSSAEEPSDSPSVKENVFDHPTETKDQMAVDLVREGLGLIGDDDEKFDAFIHDLQALIDNLDDLVI